MWHSNKYQGRAKLMLRRSGVCQKLYLLQNRNFKTLKDQCNARKKYAEYKKIKLKSVRFELVPKVHQIPPYDEAYNVERWGYWESIMRDHQRFLNRIQKTGEIINKVLIGKYEMYISNSLRHDEMSQ